MSTGSNHLKIPLLCWSRIFSYNELTKEERFRRHNVILVSIIPGPKEPSLHLNTFLKPLINDLLLLWDGVEMSLHNGSKKIIRAALLCVACDIPAGKKVWLFRAFGSDYGCSRCFHKFPGSGKKLCRLQKEQMAKAE